MADKSPRSRMSQKGKSIKEKRSDKHAKEEAAKHHEIIPPRNKH
ncbi:hypothetical protein [Intrasporangium calvum]|uniref:Uncharacterized protein n=1 Tax=Intrasporangium calvum (strain ATCC 23552 / DSM 43043 / JCM 3097 / NBRC 12989 / NCIMB 10167 / NRRL B-3866 / 7 KIP) TaxID=710696 RepID=E6SDH3_INTC7|nr:hypothetical protein [Intrasporangium calvum]ADU48625.1 hypothetical protein Intca_2115 [Intrasporangium calvum DSM 43043]